MRRAWRKRLNLIRTEAGVVCQEGARLLLVWKMEHDTLQRIGLQENIVMSKRVGCKQAWSYSDGWICMQCVIPVLGKVM